MNRKLTFGEKICFAGILAFIFALVAPGAANAQSTSDTQVGTSAGANNELNIGGAGPQTSRATALGFGSLATAPGLPMATLCVTSESSAKGILFGAYSDSGSTQKVREFCEFQDNYTALVRTCKFATAAKLQAKFMYKATGVEMEISPEDRDLSMKECLKPQVQPAPEPKIVTVEVPVPAPAPPAVKKVSLSADALFDFDKADLKAEGLKALDTLSEGLHGVDIASITVIGHTDSKGGDDYNVKLSYKRAEAVRLHLIGKGVDKNKLISYGKGEKEPVASNDTDEGRTKNRRVEIQIIGLK